MIPTPQLDEAIAGTVVAADIADDLRDKAKTGSKLGFGDLLTAVIAGNGPIVQAINGADQFKPELEAVLEDREAFGELARKLGLALFDIRKDILDPTT